MAVMKVQFAVTLAVFRIVKRTRTSYIYTYPRSIAGGIIYPRGLQPKEDMNYHSYNAESPEDPKAVRKFRLRGEVDMDYIHLQAARDC